MSKRKIILIIGFIIILAFSAVVVYGESNNCDIIHCPDYDGGWFTVGLTEEAKYSDYDYPDWVKTRTDFSFEENRNMTPEEIHHDFLKNCRAGNASFTYLNPVCVEVIVDAKLKPINEKLDYLVWCETHRDGAYGNRCAISFEKWVNTND